MSVDPESFVAFLGAATGPVAIAELDQAFCRSLPADVEPPAPAELTAGVAGALRNGWVHSDGLIVYLTASGRAMLSDGRHLAESSFAAVQ